MNISIDARLEISKIFAVLPGFLLKEIFHFRIISWLDIVHDYISFSQLLSSSLHMISLLRPARHFHYFHWATHTHYDTIASASAFSIVWRNIARYAIILMLSFSPESVIDFRQYHTLSEQAAAADSMLTKIVCRRSLRHILQSFACVS